MSTASKHRQPRLRASCDGCFLAKVKCSKARPICSRCLACGIECRYSPSSRAGKPKSDSSHNNNNHNHNNSNSNGHSHHGHHGHHSHHHHSSPVPDMAAIAAAAAAAGLSPMADEKSLLYGAGSVSGMAVPSLYKLETGWQTPASMDGPGSAITRNHSISSELALLAMDENAAAVAAAAAAANGDIYARGVPWTPPTDLSVSQFESPLGGLSMHSSSHGHHSSPHSFDFSLAAAAAAASTSMPWMDPAAMDIFPYGQSQGRGQGQQQQMPTPGSIASSANNYFPSPSTTPSLRQSPASGHKSVPPSSSSSSGDGSYQNHHHHQSSYYYGSTCACFAACLQALQALHNASTPAAPPFDVVLTLNRNAVEGCAAMLACPRCMSRSGTHTAAMLLGTVIGKITSFYKNASQSYFNSSGGTATGDMMSGVASAAAAAAAVGSTTPEMSGPSADASSLSAAAGLASSSPTSSALATGLGVSLGAYQLQGEDGRWLELEILNRELKKLEEVYTRFREVCGDLSEDIEVSKAMIGYLGQTLGSTLDLVNHRKGDLQFA